MRKTYNSKKIIRIRHYLYHLKEQHSISGRFTYLETKHEDFYLKNYDELNNVVNITEDFQEAFDYKKYSSNELNDIIKKLKQYFKPIKDYYITIQNLKLIVSGL